MKTRYALIKLFSLIAVFLISLAGVAQAQFLFLTNADQTLTITAYTGTDSMVIIPDTTNDRPVTSIGNYAFYYSTLTNVIIGNNVISIKDYAFAACFSLTTVTIGSNVTSIGNVAFSSCHSLNSVMIGNNVTNIGEAAFFNCGLTSVTIPKSVTGLGTNAFGQCLSLTRIYFQGNAPSANNWTFNSDNNPTAYYLPETTGWANFAQLTGLSTVLWNPHAQSDAFFGVRTNRFGFNIIGSSNLVIVVEACTNPATPIWTSVGTNTLTIFAGTNGTSYFSDPQWTNYPGRFYRLRSP